MQYKSVQEINALNENGLTESGAVAYTVVKNDSDIPITIETQWGQATVMPGNYTFIHPDDQTEFCVAAEDVENPLLWKEA